MAIAFCAFHQAGPGSQIFFVFLCQLQSMQWTPQTFFAKQIRQTMQVILCPRARNVIFQGTIYDVVLSRILRIDLNASGVALSRQCKLDVLFYSRGVPIDLIDFCRADELARANVLWQRNNEMALKIMHRKYKELADQVLT
jgi:hypothetical protein